eukprot:6456714-Amphidinium_carterae.1
MFHDADVVNGTVQNYGFCIQCTPSHAPAAVTAPVDQTDINFHSGLQHLVASSDHKKSKL